MARAANSRRSLPREASGSGLLGLWVRRLSANITPQSAVMWPPHETESLISGICLSFGAKHWLGRPQLRVYACHSASSSRCKTGSYRLLPLLACFSDHSYARKHPETPVLTRPHSRQCQKALGRAPSHSGRPLCQCFSSFSCKCSQRQEGVGPRALTGCHSRSSLKLRQFADAVCLELKTPMNFVFYSLKQTVLAKQ